MITSRLARSEDIDAIMRLLAQARAAILELGIDQWQDGYPERELIAYDIELGRGFFYLVDGEPAAYAVLMSAPEPIYDALEGEWLCDGAYLTIHRMGIGDGFRGTGLAQRMLSDAQEFARAQGCLSVRADTHAGNLRMRRLLKRSGYENCGRVRYDCSGDPYRVAYERRI